MLALSFKLQNYHYTVTIVQRCAGNPNNVTRAQEYIIDHEQGANSTKPDSWDQPHSPHHSYFPASVLMDIYSMSHQSLMHPWSSAISMYSCI